MLDTQVKKSNQFKSSVVIIVTKKYQRNGKPGRGSQGSYISKKKKTENMLGILRGEGSRKLKTSKVWMGWVGWLEKICLTNLFYLLFPGKFLPFSCIICIYGL